MAKQAHVFDRQSEESFSMTDLDGSQNKHRNKAQYRKELEELEELEALAKGGDPNEPNESDEDDDERDIDTTDKKKKNDDTDWKKRYGDLRSYLSQKEHEWKEKETTLTKQVKEAGKKEKVYPKTESEIKEWIEEYPDVGAIIQTIAGQTTDESIAELKAEIAELRKGRAQDAFQQAYNKLLKLQPDFDDLRQTDDFKEWLASQPPVFQSALTNPTFDDVGIKAASRVVDMYKSEKGLAKKSDTPDSTKDKEKRREAAESIRQSRNSSPSSERGERTFKESEIAAMSDKEFEKNEEAILAAQKAGHIIFDLSKKA